MKLEMLYSKIHRATVTDANLNYQGSITIDTDLMKAAKIYEHQKVDIYDIDNGERFSTYVINGEAGSGAMCLNGAAARKVHVGDKIIIAAYAQLEKSELEGYEPTVVFVDQNNKIVQN